MTKKKATTKQKSNCGAKAPVKRRNTAVASTKAPKRATEKKSAKTPKAAGAIGSMQDVKEITVTKNKISVTRERSVNKQGKYTKHTTREYHDRTPANMRAFNEILNRKGLKKVTVKLK